MLLCSILTMWFRVHLPVIEAGNASAESWSLPMKNLILAAVAALSLTAAIAPLANAAVFHNGSTVSGDRTATRIQQTGSYSQ
jgi:hypothetical protein